MYALSAYLTEIACCHGIGCWRHFWLLWH